MKILIKVAEIFDTIVAELLEYKVFIYALLLLMLLVNGEASRILQLRLGDTIAYVTSMIGFGIACYCLGYMKNNDEED